MPTHRNLALGAGVALASASLMLAGAVASTAVQPRAGADHNPVESASVIPRADAPHSGQVAGVRYGSDVSLNNPSSVHAFRVLHRGLIPGSHPKAGSAIDTIHPSDGTSFNADTVGSQGDPERLEGNQASPRGHHALHADHVSIRR